MFDRIKRGITLPYTDIEKGRAYMQQLEWPNTLTDVEALQIREQFADVLAASRWYSPHASRASQKAYEFEGSV